MRIPALDTTRHLKISMNFQKESSQNYLVHQYQETQIGLHLPEREEGGYLSTVSGGDSR